MWALIGTITALVFGSASAWAAAAVKVTVHVRGQKSSPDLSGPLRLEPRATTVNKASYSCQVSAGKCSIGGVHAGAYLVSFSSSDGKYKVVGKKVMIPDSGEVDLKIAAQPAK